MIHRRLAGVLFAVFAALALFAPPASASVQISPAASFIMRSQYASTAFGENYIPGTNEAVPQRYTFAGREASANSAAGAPMFYRNRMYSPGLGRFGRRDPMLGGDRLCNAYGFPTENAVMGADPRGLGDDACECNKDNVNKDNSHNTKNYRIISYGVGTEKLSPHFEMAAANLAASGEYLQALDTALGIIAGGLVPSAAGEESLAGKIRTAWAEKSKRGEKGIAVADAVLSTGAEVVQNRLEANTPVMPDLDPTAMARDLAGLTQEFATILGGRYPWFKIAWDECMCGKRVTSTGIIRNTYEIFYKWEKQETGWKRGQGVVNNEPGGSLQGFKSMQALASGMKEQRDIAIERCHKENLNTEEKKRCKTALWDQNSWTRLLQAEDKPGQSENFRVRVGTEVRKKVAPGSLK